MRKGEKKEFEKVKAEGLGREADATLSAIFSQERGGGKRGKNTRGNCMGRRTEASACFTTATEQANQ